MKMFQCIVLLFGAIVAVVTGTCRVPRKTCFGLDISKEPAVEAKQIDGWWYQQRISKNALSLVPANSIFFWQFQGTADWSNDWDPKTKKCTYRKFEESQKQSVTSGPFSPCWNARQVLPIEAEEPRPMEYLYWMPNSNILMYYTCLGKILRNKKCVGKPFVGVLTKTLNISRRELRIVSRKLKSFKISMRSLKVVRPRENCCQLPMINSRRSEARRCGRNHRDD